VPEARGSLTSDKGRGKNGMAPSKHFFFYRATTKGNRVFRRAYRIFCGFSVVIVILLVQVFYSPNRGHPCLRDRNGRIVQFSLGKGQKRIYQQGNPTRTYLARPQYLLRITVLSASLPGTPLLSVKEPNGRSFIMFSRKPV